MIWFEPVDADKQYRSDGQDHDGVNGEGISPPLELIITTASHSTSQQSQNLLSSTSHSAFI